MISMGVIMGDSASRLVVCFGMDDCYLYESEILLLNGDQHARFDVGS